MISTQKTPLLESILALNMSLQGNFDKSITNEESEKNLYTGMVSVITEESTAFTPLFDTISRGSGTGIMITSDGFILTAQHVIDSFNRTRKQFVDSNKPPANPNFGHYSKLEAWLDEVKKKYRVVDQQGNTYALDPTFCACNPYYDIALVKAVIPKKPGPMRFKIIEQELTIGCEIKMFGIKDEKQYNQFGKVINSGKDAVLTGQKGITYHDTFLTDAYGVQGFSGGIFVTLEGALAGIAIYSAHSVRIGENEHGVGKGMNRNNRNGNNGCDLGAIGGAKAKRVLSLVNAAAHGLGGIYMRPNE